MRLGMVGMRRFCRMVAMLCLTWAGAGAQSRLAGNEPEIGQARDTGAASATFRLESIRIGGNLEGVATSPGFRLELFPPALTVPHDTTSRDTTPPTVVITYPGIDTVVNTPSITVSYSVDGVA